MDTSTLPDHLRRPHVRPIQPLPVQKDGKQFVALRDPAMLVKQTMVVQPVALQAIRHFQGQRDVDDIAETLKAPVDRVVALAKGLDQVGLLWGPTFEQLENQRRDQLASHGAFPPGHTASLGEDEAACRKAIDDWLNQTDDPEIEETIVGLVAPHLDYERGWPNYAAAYRGLDRVETPDRVVVLGTNHYGLGDGVILSQYAFETPMGRMPADEAVVNAMVQRLGKPLTVDELDHMPEHSVRLQLPWLQHRFGNLPLVAALIPDPLTPPVEDNDERVTLERFVENLAEVLDDLGGNTFFVASSDLSHVGPQFGEPRPVDDQRRQDVERHDREMMGKFCDADPEDFLAAMRWGNNPTRWCSVGNMCAVLSLARPDAVELIDYRQASDEKGMVMVSSAAMALVRDQDS